MSVSRKKPHALPMVRLNTAMPFLEAARDARADIDSILQPLNLAQESFLDADRFVTAPIMYTLVEDLADACPDKCVGYRLGMMLDPFAWPPLIQASQSANSLGDLLVRFSVDAHDHASSVVYKLVTEGPRTTFYELRSIAWWRKPRHNDAFGVAYLISILRQAVGKSWHGSEVLANICDPAVIPVEEHDIRTARSGSGGFSISFPSSWLLLKPDLLSTQASSLNMRSDQSTAPKGIVAAVGTVLEGNLANKLLDSAGVAKLCGISERTMARRLREQGTSFSAELSKLRQLQAERELADTNASVTEIAHRVGYESATVFGRAFKRWTGMTPVEFRHAYRISTSTPK